MRRGVPQLFIVVCVAFLATIVLAACGGGDDSSSTGTTTATESAAQDNQDSGGGYDRSSPQSDSESGDGNEKSASSGDSSDGGGDSSNSGSSGGSGSSKSNVKAAPLQVSGGGSEQFRSKGGDNSIQDFGDEADEAELEEAAAALHGYLVARAQEDWSAGCSYFTKGMQQQLEALGSQSQLKDKDCAAILSAMTATATSGVLQELTEVDAVSLRREDERAFLIYRGGGDTVYFVPMAQEDGAWKVGALAPTALL